MMKGYGIEGRMANGNAVPLKGIFATESEAHAFVTENLDRIMEVLPVVEVHVIDYTPRDASFGTLEDALLAEHEAEMAEGRES